MAESISKVIFQVKSLATLRRSGYDYGLKVAKAIEAEWFKRDSGTNRF